MHTVAEREALNHAAKLLQEYAIDCRAHAGLVVSGSAEQKRYVDTMMTVLQLRRIADGMPLLDYRPPKSDLMEFERVVRGRARGPKKLIHPDRRSK